MFALKNKTDHLHEQSSWETAEAGIKVKQEDCSRQNTLCKIFQVTWKHKQPPYGQLPRASQFRLLFIHSRVHSDHFCFPLKHNPNFLYPSNSLEEDMPLIKQ